MSVEAAKRFPEILKHPRHIVQEVATAGMSLYLKSYHEFTVDIPHVPVEKGALFLTAHFSLLDVPALMVGDPRYPRTTFAVKREMWNSPFRPVFWLWQTPVVDRDGKDRGAVAKIRKTLEEGNGVCIAAQGTRSRTGRLGPMDKSLVKLALFLHSLGTPVIPLAEPGTYDALPAGRKGFILTRFIPKPVPVSLVSGPPIDLSEWVQLWRKTRKNNSEEALIGAAAAIQGALAELLPEENRPAQDERVMWTSAEYARDEGSKKHPFLDKIAGIRNFVKGSRSRSNKQEEKILQID